MKNLTNIPPFALAEHPRHEQAHIPEGDFGAITNVPQHGEGGGSGSRRPGRWIWKLPTREAGQDITGKEGGPRWQGQGALDGEDGRVRRTTGAATGMAAFTASDAARCEPATTNCYSLFLTFFVCCAQTH